MVLSCANTLKFKCQWPVTQVPETQRYQIINNVRFLFHCKTKIKMMPAYFFC